MRGDGRTASQLRPIRMIPGFTTNNYGSVLVDAGETKVLCTAYVEDSLPNWLRRSSAKHGWLTAEYSMLPGSTSSLKAGSPSSRSKRERGHVSGRTQEIQRLVGRSLRGVLDLAKMPDFTIIIDCDVLQADGGTRTASITGGFVALKMAINRLLKEKRIKSNPIREAVAAVSVGVKEDKILLDLDYQEDSSVDVDMNVVMTKSGKLLEIQGTAEHSFFTKEHVISIIDTAQEALGPVFDAQQETVQDGHTVEV